MFVQAAHYAKRQKEKHGDNHYINLRAYGVERTGETANLAKMNLFLNNSYFALQKVPMNLENSIIFDK